MNSKPKVLYVVNSLSGGGAEKSSRLVFSKLVNLDFDLQLIALNADDTHNTVYGDRETVLNRNWKDGFRSTIKNYLVFTRKVIKYKPAIIVAHCELPELYVAFLPVLKIKIIAVEHTSSPWNGRKPLGRLVRSTLRAKRTVWVSVIKGGAPIWFGAKIPLVILNPASRSEKSTTFKIEERFVFIGRLREEKRPTMAINAVIGGNQAIGLIGDGDLEEKLHSDYLTVTDKVKFYGYIDDPWNKLREDALVIMPSEYEGDGLVAVEAIINGYAIIMSDNPDLRRFNLPAKHYFKTSEDLNAMITLALKEGSSFFIPPKDCQREIASQRNIEEIALQWQRLFRSLTNRM
jgi:glycosyltransferase involved in cell wall biosynthesis